MKIRANPNQEQLWYSEDCIEDSVPHVTETTWQYALLIYTTCAFYEVSSSKTPDRSATLWVQLSTHIPSKQMHIRKDVIQRTNQFSSDNWITAIATSATIST